MDEVTRNKLREIQGRPDNCVLVTPEEFDAQVLVGKLDGTFAFNTNSTVAFLVNYNPKPIGFDEAVDIIYNTPDASVMDHRDFMDSNLDFDDSRYWYNSDFLIYAPIPKLKFILVMLRKIQRTNYV